MKVTACYGQGFILHRRDEENKVFSLGLSLVDLTLSCLSFRFGVGLFFRLEVYSFISRGFLLR